MTTGLPPLEMGSLAAKIPGARVLLPGMSLGTLLALEGEVVGEKEVAMSCSSGGKTDTRDAC